MGVPIGRQLTTLLSHTGQPAGNLSPPSYQLYFSPGSFEKARFSRRVRDVPVTNSIVTGHDFVATADGRSLLEV